MFAFKPDEDLSARWFETFPEGGLQLMFYFENGYGASVIRHRGSWGNKEGLFELAVIKGDRNYWILHKNNPVANGDVLGYLTIEDVNNALRRIKNL